MVHPEEWRLSLYRESWAGVPVEWHFCSVAPRRGRWKAVLELKPALLLLFRTFTNLMWPIGKKAAKSQLSIKLNRITSKRKSKFRDNMTMYCPWNITNRDKTKLTMVSTCWLKNYQESAKGVIKDGLPKPLWRLLRGGGRVLLSGGVCRLSGARLSVLHPSGAGEQK